MSSFPVTDDYYSILEVEFGASIHVVKSSYRRLALQLHPDKNPNNPTATAKFQLLIAAYGVIYDADKRRKYDKIWPSIRLSKQSSERATQKQRAEATHAERKRAAAEHNERKKAEEKARAEAASKLQKQKEKEEEKLAWKRQREVLRARLSKFTEQRGVYESTIFELKRTRTRLNAEIKHLDEQDKDAPRSEEARNSWGDFFFGVVKTETEEEKQRREVDRIDREAIRRIKSSLLNEVDLGLQMEEAMNSTLDAEIEQVRSELSKSHVEEKRKEAEREAESRAQEARDRENERLAAERKAQNQREREAKLRAKESLARERRQHAEACQARKRAEEAEKARRKSEEREAAESRRNRKTAKGKGDRERPDATDTPPRGTQPQEDCKHKKYWKVIEGSHVCSVCNKPQRHSAFECPACAKIACASCRVKLKNGKPAKGFKPRQRPAFQ